MTTVVLSRAQASRPDHETLEREILDELERQAGVRVTVIPHLHDLKSTDPGIEWLRTAAGDLIVLGWLYPRALYWVLAANHVFGRLGQLPLSRENEIDGSTRTIWCLDLREHDRAGPYLEVIAEIVSRESGEASRPTAASPTGLSETTPASRWYPVIDRDRCTDCLECLNFCLFGVYGLDDADSILIEQPDACRAGCPACSRICPAGAIMFPEHNDPAIAGDPEASLESLKLDLSQLFAGTNPAELAASERDRALADRQAPKKNSPDGKPEEPAQRDALDRLVDELDDLEL